MSVFAINGAAGCGKTYTIMEKLAVTLQEAPLKPSQKVLALTFMHGSRQVEKSAPG
jgi:superfamily I DNA/RNA helicase